MATIVIRNLDQSVKRRLKVRAALNGRSMEAEARQVLQESLDQVPQSAQEVDIGTAIHRRFAALGGVDLQIPPRTFSNKPLPTFDE
jgi:plasmid stability protein